MKERLDKLHSNSSSLISTPSSSLRRIFCAIELPSEIRAQVEEHITKLRAAMPDVRASWERPEKLHITLKFLGDIEQARIPSLSLAAERAAQDVRPFELALDGTGAFSPHGHARILWIGIPDQSHHLARLHERLEEESALEGFAREERAFHPHLTIARLRTPQGARALATLHREMPFHTEAFSVNEIIVMHSELGPGGSRYTPLSRHRLGEA
jgi:2'-5' RNA ligase